MKICKLSDFAWWYVLLLCQSDLSLALSFNKKVEIRERDWCNVVTCHMDTEKAYVWRLQNFVIGEHILRPCPENPTPVKACAISTSGNFAVLGTAGGWIERFNLQSGISRGSYVDTPKGSAHDGESAADWGNKGNMGRGRC
ncbi:hypothetical protein ES288_A11G158200v1 [Gossypium darwinii]|uniref:Anaphase-promoting complex subunit 4 WD40 domain-containing protein n=1 Tax=Gossypium darwinii TaxID=34276 RepID=A0A5D2EKQ7_GOSDA|nr:hypothetical protein ES288_A11G158200v1 [Gossypium darwinii]